MRVLHVIPSLSSQLGGPTQVALNLVKYLGKQGVQAEIATTNDDGPGLIKDKPLGQRVDYQEVPVWFFARSARLKEFIPSIDFTYWLWQNVRHYDLIDIHYLFSYLSSCAATVSRIRDIPYTVRTMGQLSPWALAQSKVKKQLYTFLLERRNLSNASAIHATSLGELEDINQFGIKAQKVILPLGVCQSLKIVNAKNLLRKKYLIPDTVPIVLFLSRLHYKKRPDLLIKALGLLALQNYSFHLILAGSGELEYLNSLNSLIASLYLSQKTTFAGFVTGYEKDLLLQGSDLFVLPTHSENFGIAIAEAMASGLPVVTTPGAQIAPDILKARAGIIVDGEIESIQRGVASLLTSATLREELGENGRKFAVQNYTWPHIAQNLAQVYAAILSQKPLPVFN